VATISGTGLVVTVNGVALGAATITVATQDGNNTASCAVTVVEVTAPAIYITGKFGLYVDGQRDMGVGDNQVWETRVDDSYNTYTVGWRYDASADRQYEPCLYKNGVPNILPMAHMGGDKEACAYGLWVADGHVYAVGFGQGLDGMINARLWIDGEPSPLQGIGEVNSTYSYAYAVRERNGDVYVAGGADGGADGPSRPAIWKNGTKYIMPGSFTYLGDMDFASNGGLYVFGNRAIYKVAADLSGMTQEPMDSGYPMHMSIDSADIYAAGYSGDDACYWKNGTRHTVPRPAGATWAEAHDIYVYGGHAYMSGRSSGGGTYRVELWIDGAHIADARRPDYATATGTMVNTSRILAKQ
jgi:hypothetical protein